jgi:hypothetical protein
LGEVAEHRAGLHRFFSPVTIAARLPATRDAAYTSTAFNCGIGAIGKSTATKRLNAVDGRVDREYAAGQLAERLVWQEQQRKAQIKAEAKAKAQQAEIDAAAFEYASQQRADEQHIASLEEAIRLQKDEDLGPPDPKTGPVCHPGIPGGVSTRIDAIGR